LRTASFDSDSSLAHIYGIPKGAMALAGVCPALLTKILTILRRIAVNLATVLSTKSEC